MITESEISKLRREADEHGDLRMAAICLVALGESREDAEPGTELAECKLTAEQAWAECERVIGYAAAQEPALEALRHAPIDDEPDPTPEELLTDEQIERLRDAAATAGDVAQVMICDTALIDGHSVTLPGGRVLSTAECRAECARVLRDGDQD